MVILIILNVAVAIIRHNEGGTISIGSIKTLNPQVMRYKIANDDPSTSLPLSSVQAAQGDVRLRVVEV